MQTKLFGTDGIRRKVGKAPLICEDIFTLGKSISLWAKEKYNNNTKILIGHDTRISCHAIKSALKSGLLLYDVEIYDAGVLPTPAIVSMVENNKAFHCGIIITASHNEAQDNGIKIIDYQTGKLEKNDEDKITDLFFSKDIEKNNYAEFGKDINFKQADETYIETITNQFETDFLHGIKIILDCANGATYNIAPKIFKNLGAKVITIANNPDGKNINYNCGSTHPQNLQKEVVKNNADIGFAFDGDGDRVVAVNKHGNIKDGDDILCILADNPFYKNQKNIVGTVFTNYGFESYLKNNGKHLIRTKVGDKFVAKKLKEKNLLLGGEPSGHLIMRDYITSSDGIFTALKVIETVKLTNNWDLETFEKFPQIIINVPVKNKKDLATSPFSCIIAENKNKLKNGRIIVRYSGTENLLRVMVEEEDNNVAKNICFNLSEKLKVELNK